MALRLGVDFGTATTCVAVIRDLSDLTPDVVPIDGRSFASSTVWVDSPNGKGALVQSRSVVGRCPLSVFSSAQADFDAYWKQRVAAQADGVKWYRWKQDRREESMLLSYFKPELSDTPQPVEVAMPGQVTSDYDPMTQSENLEVYYVTRKLASPTPDTDDLIAATAALLRDAVRAAVLRYGDRVSRLAIGLPSFAGGSDAGEKQLATDRREAAVELARIAADFGARDFRVQFLGEAQAAAVGLDVESEEPTVYSVVVDVGAGTTDLALVPYTRGPHGRYRAEAPVMSRSLRFAGRDMNTALAAALMLNRQIRTAYSFMDERSWQLLVDEDVERIKRGLARESKTFKIPFPRYAAHYEGNAVDAARAELLRRAVFEDLSLHDPAIRAAIQSACKKWLAFIAAFLSDVAEHLGPGVDLSAIELVGGAFKFEPLHLALKGAVRKAGLNGVPVRFRNVGDESQTVVARGLARWVALQ